MLTSRRAVLTCGSLVVAGAVAGGAADPATAAPREDGARPARERAARRAVTPFRSAMFDDEGLFVLGAAGAGTADVGEVLTTFDNINARTGNPANLRRADFDAYVAEFLATGRRLASLARSSDRAGHAVSARYQHLRASNCMTQALFFVLGTGRPGREEEFFDLVDAQWQDALDAMTPPPARFTVRSGRYAIPVYFFRPGNAAGPRPTLIISNGSDGQNVETMQFGVVAGLERGYNVALFEGPGQMSLLFRRQIPFTPDWDQVIGTVVRALMVRPDVRSDRIALIGVSFAGMLCARAAARTRGLRAVVLEPAAVDMARIWGDPRNLATVRRVRHAPPAVRAKVRREINAGFLRAWPHLAPQTQFEIHKRSEIFQVQALRDARAGRPPADYFGLLETILEYDFAADYRAITIPALLTANEGDTFFGRQPYEAFGLLVNVPPAAKKLIVFRAAEGAQRHDQPMAPQFAQETIFNWLDARLLS